MDKDRAEVVTGVAIYGRIIVVISIKLNLLLSKCKLNIGALCTSATQKLSVFCSHKIHG